MFLRNYVGSLSTMALVETFLPFIKELLESNSSWNTDYSVFRGFTPPLQKSAETVP